jgi:methylated-DNA-protein-cysteine methyltransferase related protein
MDPEELWQLVRSIPKGKVASYGDIGAALSTPTSGFQIGRWMARCPENLPWWRVVSKQGRFPVGKRDPRLEMEQGDILEREGVEVDGDTVDMSRFGYVP